MEREHIGLKEELPPEVRCKGMPFGGRLVASATVWHRAVVREGHID